MRYILSILIASIGLIVTTAQAHQIWLEQPADQSVVIRFGEFGDNLRETSPGLLDMFAKPAATLISSKGETALSVTKAADGFKLSTTPANGESIIAEDAVFPVHKFTRDGKEVSSWFWPAARYVSGFAAQAPKLTLDIVPTGNTGEFKVSLKGQPLAKAEVHIVVQSGWAKEAHTNEQGLVKFDLPWQGQYVLEVSHIDHTPGERKTATGTEKYDGINYETTLTLVNANGVAAVAAGPVTPPNKK